MTAALAKASASSAACTWSPSAETSILPAMFAMWLANMGQSTLARTDFVSYGSRIVRQSRGRGSQVSLHVTDRA